MAVQILGIRQCKRALPEFKKILASDENHYYFLRMILLAVAKFEDSDCEEILHQAKSHPSELVSLLAAELLAELYAGKKRNLWDLHTG